MNVCVYGMGAVGGLIAGRLAQAGVEVSAVARGATLAAVQQHGLRLQGPEGTVSVALHATDDPSRLGVQDVVILAVKAPALPGVAARVAPLLGPHTVVLTAMNGVPWWFFDVPGVPFSGMRLPSLDAGGAVLYAIPHHHILGCVVHLSSSSPSPGVIRPGLGNRLIIGEPSGVLSARTTALASMLQRAGFDAQASDKIRTDIWYKLWGNMTLNPMSAITGATVDAILADPLLEQFCLDAMAEAAAIGSNIGCPISESGHERLAVGRKLGAFKTSMLQDAEVGKPLEIDALITAVHEIGRVTGVPTPNIDALLGLIRVYAQSRGLYR